MFQQVTWFVNVNKKSNFDKLDPEQQKEIDKQLDNDRKNTFY